MKKIAILFSILLSTIVLPFSNTVKAQENIMIDDFVTTINAACPAELFEGITLLNMVNREGSVLMDCSTSLVDLKDNEAASKMLKTYLEKECVDMMPEDEDWELFICLLAMDEKALVFRFPVEGTKPVLVAFSLQEVVSWINE
ncbi:MAG: hypothetical protein J1F20_03665 [Muribaculaceae bacterium]|nr:hypothetical protein [Muribaculaceae bacterium]